MPLKTNTVNLLEEHARLDSRLDDLADRVADEDDVEGAVEEAQRVENHLAGVQWALDHEEWPDDPSVILGALTTGEMAEVRDRTASAREEAKQFGGHGQAEGAASTFFVAAGVQDAPFVDGDASVDALVPVIANELHPQFTQWLESRVDDLSSVGNVNATPFAERVAARTSDDTSTSSSPKQS